MRAGRVIAFALLGAGVALAGTRTPAATAIETTLQKRGADGTVLLGNSKVSTDLDLDLLQKLLPDAGHIANANVFGTGAPVWYAVLENRVYGNGHAPKRLVVFAPLTAMLTTDLPTENARAVLGEQLGENEPVITTKVFDGLLDTAVRERLHRLLLPACDPNRIREQDDTPGKPGKIVPKPEAAPESSFLADILALTHAHGTPTVFVRAPLGPSKAGQDAVPPERVAATRAFVESQGARWIDLSAGAPEAAFGDGIHMNVAGRARMTAILANALKEAPPPPEPPIVKSVRRTGTPPAAVPLTITRGEGCARTGNHPLLTTLGGMALVARGLGPISPLVPRQGNAVMRAPPDLSFWAGCTGVYAAAGDALRMVGWPGLGEAYSLVPSTDLPLRAAGGEVAWWVYPGTTLEIDTAPLAANRVRIDALSIGPGSATWSLGDTALPLDRPARANGETHLAVTSPPDGPWVLVHGIFTGDRPILGDAPVPHLDLLSASVAYAAPPPPLPPMGIGKPAPDGASLRLDLPPGVPTEEAGFNQAGQARCSPLQVLRDGAPPEGLNTIAMNNGVLIATKDCGAVAGRAEGLTWQLDPERACRGREGPRWVYPGDVLTLSSPLPPSLIASDEIRLDLGGGLIGPPDETATLTIRALADGAEIARTTVPRASFDSTPPSFTIPTRALRGKKRLDVQVAASPGTTWLMLTSAVIVPGDTPRFTDWGA